MLFLVVAATPWLAARDGFSHVPSLVCRAAAGLLFLPFLISVARAAPIDCAKASTATEKAICDDRDLVITDKNLDLAYGALLKVLPDDERPKAVAEQLDWLRLRNQCRADRRCLSHRHSERTAAVKD